MYVLYILYANCKKKYIFILLFVPWVILLLYLTCFCLCSFFVLVRFVYVPLRWSFSHQTWTLKNKIDNIYNNNLGIYIYKKKGVENICERAGMNVFYNGFKKNEWIIIKRALIWPSFMSICPFLYALYLTYQSLLLLFTFTHIIWSLLLYIYIFLIIKILN